MILTTIQSLPEITTKTLPKAQGIQNPQADAQQSLALPPTPIFCQSAFTPQYSQDSPYLKNSLTAIKGIQESAPKHTSCSECVYMSQSGCQCINPSIPTLETESISQRPMRPTLEAESHYQSEACETFQSEDFSSNIYFSQSYLTETTQNSLYPTETEIPNMVKSQTIIFCNSWYPYAPKYNFLFVGNS